VPTESSTLSGERQRPFGRRARWWVLGFISLSNLGSYYVYDAIAPVADLLHRQLGLSYADIGSLNAIYSLPNVFVALLGGMLSDRLGPARVCMWTSAICFVGTVLTAIGAHFWVMALGRFLFGVGGETLFVALLTGLGQWFIGPKLGVAMALFFSIARLGSYLADLSPQLFNGLYRQGWQPPLVLSAAIAGMSFLATVAYALIDRHRVASQPVPAGQSMNLRALGRLDSHVWGLLLMGMLFYAVVFPFRSTFSIEYFQGAKGLSLQEAGVANSWVFFAAIFASPAFGWLADRSRHKAALLAAGMFSLTASFYILGATRWPLWVTTALVGFSYSLVPAVIWPAVAERVPVQRLGATLGLMTILQNIGMTASNVIVGWLDDRAHAGVGNPAGYAPMLWFFGVLSLTGTIIGVWLWMRTSSAAHSTAKCA
jgi:MFS family permease